ncbi:ras-specific guanine nucleotide-releasing factor 2 [Biomphalaria glabrata]
MIGVTRCGPHPLHLLVTLLRSTNRNELIKTLPGLSCSVPVGGDSPYADSTKGVTAAPRLSYCSRRLVASMQKNIRISEGQLLYLANKARVENTMCGYLYKRSTDLGKWQQRYFVLYQNVLFYYENENSTRPSGVALLEGSYCDRIIAPAAMKGRETDKQVSIY